MNNINDLRSEMFDAMKLLKQGKIDATQARAIADLGNVVINSAKAETDFVRTFGGRTAVPASGFIGQAPKPAALDQQARMVGPMPEPSQPGAGLPPRGPQGRM